MTKHDDLQSSVQTGEARLKRDVRRFTVKVCPSCGSDRWDHGFGCRICDDCGAEYGRPPNRAERLQVIEAPALEEWLLEQIAEERAEARLERADAYQSVLDFIREGSNDARPD